MSADVHTLAIPNGSLPPPLVPTDLDTSSATHCMLSLRDLRDSDWLKQLDMADRYAAIALHLESMRCLPSGTLPNNDTLLASYVGLSVREVDLFREMKPRIMQGWVLCGDNRFHHREAASRSLRLSIETLEGQRRGAVLNQNRFPEADFGIREIDAKILQYAGYLRVLDPRGKFLRDLTLRIARWSGKPKKGGPKPSEVAEENGHGTAIGVANGVTVTGEACTTPSTVTLMEWNGIEEDSSSELCSEDSRSSQNHEKETGAGRGSVERTGQVAARTVALEPWPQDWFGRFKTRYPRKRSWGDAEKALEKVRKAGKTPFEAIMTGIDRLIAEGRAPEFVPYPGSWVRDRGWEDEPDPPSGGPRGTPPSGGRAPRRNTTFQAAERIISEYRHGRSPSRDPFSS